MTIRKSIGSGQSPGTLARYELNLAYLEVSQEQWQAAEGACQKFLGSKPDSETRMEANALLAKCFVAQNRLSEAAETLRRALALRAPKNLRILPLDVLSDVLERQGLKEDAYLAAKEASSLLVPRSGFGVSGALTVNALFNRLERLCRETGRENEASEWKQKAMSIPLVSFQAGESDSMLLRHKIDDTPLEAIPHMDNDRPLGFGLYLIRMIPMGAGAIGSIIGFAGAMHYLGDGLWQKLVFLLGAVFLIVFFGSSIVTIRRESFRDSLKTAAVQATLMVIATILTVVVLLLMKIGCRFASKHLL